MRQTKRVFAVSYFYSLQLTNSAVFHRSLVEGEPTVCEHVIWSRIPRLIGEIQLAIGRRTVNVAVRLE